jgi:Helicase conserved C-terminal domain
LLQRVLVGTSCISLGLDHPNVRHVWLYGDPHDAITFIQTASRAGRSGKPAFVRLFASKSYGSTNDGALEEFKSTSGCRRTPFSLLLDGRSVTCAALPHAAQCDNCADPKEPVSSVPHPAAFMTATKTESIRRADYASVVRALFSSLRMLQSNCCFCLLRRRPGGHSWQECPDMPRESLASLKAALLKVHTRDSIPHLAVCTQCQIPQKGGHGLGMDDHGQTYDVVTNTCGYVDTSLAIMLSLLDSPMQRERLLRCTPSQREAQVIPYLLSPISTHPCSKSDTGRQLLQYHFVIIAAVGESPYATSEITDVCHASWFSQWSRSMAPEDIHESVLPNINFLLPLEQPPSISKKRTLNRTEESSLPAPKKARPNMILGEEDLVPRQWPFKPPTKSKNLAL